MAESITITQRKVLLAEGRDAELFLVWACREYRQAQDFQVLDFGGVTELEKYLSTLATVEGYARIETLVIARDAETNAATAADSIKNALAGMNLPVPSNPFVYASGVSQKTAFLIFPGPNQENGTLEDLCLEIVKDDPIMPCVEDYVECLRGKTRGQRVNHIWKRKLHSFLAGKDVNLIGASIGQASYRRAWAPQHPALEPFKQVIQNM